MSCSAPIGVIDSGLGGISVLKYLCKVLPHENFLYYADSDNAPYGMKSDSEINRLMTENISFLVGCGCKAVVIACNTATAVAAEDLRIRFDIPIIGLEPALKPAFKSFPSGSILVLATPVTLSHKKFTVLLNELDNGRVSLAALPYLVTLIEKGLADSDESIQYISSVLGKFNGTVFDACVLGCTHFPFAKNAITLALGYTPMFFDGSYGAANRLATILKEYEILNKDDALGNVKWCREYPGKLHLKLYNSKI